MKYEFKQLNRNGFTLIEVLIALAILAIGLLMAANLQTTAIAGNKSSSEMSVGTLLGQEAIELLLTYDSSSDVSLAGGNHTASSEQLNHPSLIPDTTVNGILYTRSYTVYTGTTSNNPGPGIRTIVMNIQWTDKTSHSVVMVERTTP